MIRYKEKTFNLEGGQILGKVRKEVVEPPSVEVLKTLLDMALSNLIWLARFEHGVGLDDLWSSLPD